MNKFGFIDDDDEIEEYVKESITLLDADTMVFDMHKTTIEEDEDGNVYAVKSDDIRTELKFERKRRKLPKRLEQELRDIYTRTLVIDYGDEDDYHLSETERHKRNKFYEIFKRINNRKRKYKNLDDFIRAFRNIIDCVVEIAEENGVYNKEEFISKVYTQQIFVHGLTMPRYIGKDKKHLNWEEIVPYILDKDMDINEIFSVSEDTQYEDYIEDIPDEMRMNYIFGEETANKLVNEATENAEDAYISAIETEDITKKEFKLLRNTCPEISYSINEFIKENRRRNNKNKALSDFTYSMTQDDYDKIAKIDSKRGLSRDIAPVFNEDIMSDDSFGGFSQLIMDYTDIHDTVRVSNNNIKRIEWEEISALDEFRHAGTNTLKFYGEIEKKKRLERSYKKAEKEEKALKKRLIKLQDKQKTRNDMLKFNKQHGAKNKKGKKAKEDD